MSDTLVTVQGWVGGEVVFRTPKEISVANFRVGSTPRVKRNGSWQDGETTWYSVTAWRELADHVKESIHRGDPVIVHGRLSTRTWSPGEGEPDRSVLEVDAITVGHDLRNGTSVFLKQQRPARSATSDLDAEVADMVAASFAEEATAADVEAPAA